jgi:citrate synthase
VAPDNTWTTSITEIQPNSVRVRGYDMGDLMGRITFGQAVYLLLRGELPNENVGQLMDAILVSSIDHGATPPSVLAVRNAASTGASLSAAVASGVLAINTFHGGAIEECALQLGQIIQQCDHSGDDPIRVAEALIEEMKRNGRRMSGFGHRVHTNDPRKERLFALAEQAGVSGRHIEAARAVEEVFRSGGKPLPINVDGAIAAVLADLGFEPSVMNGIFMIARLPGLVAHADEEMRTQKPMRRIDQSAARYDGPPARSMK